MNARHPMIGSWRVAVDVGGAHGPTNLAMLSSDGTILVAFPSPTPAAPGANHRLEYWTPAVGSWTAAAEGGATMAFVAVGVDENGVSIGTHTIAATVASDDQGWHGPFTIEIAGPDGTALGSATGRVTATRIGTNTR